MQDLFKAPPDHFDEFWQAYPRKIGKGAARKAYARALRITDHDTIMGALSDQRPAMEAKESKFIPHASTWLNQERWEDEPEQPNDTPPGGGGGNSKADAGDKQIAFAARFARSPSEDCF